MSPLLEKIILEILKRLIDEDAVYAAKVAIVEFVYDLSKKSDNKLDDFAVEILAQALGVPSPVPGLQLPESHV